MASGLAVPIYENVNAELFQTTILPQMKPALLRGFDIGPCTRTWSVDYLSRKIGSLEVKLHVTQHPKMDFISKNFIYRSLPFETFIKRASEKLHKDFFIVSDELYYLRSVGDNARKDTADFMKQFPQVAHDINFPCFFPTNRFFSSVFRISSEGIQMWTHYDMMDNFLIQVCGRKRVVLYSPEDVEYMYLNGDKSEILDIDNPDLEKYPKFQKSIRNEAILEPGDILYIPALWFHNTLALNFSIGVNIFWYNSDPQLFDPKDLYGNKDLPAASQALRHIEKGIALLSELPEEYRKFYGRRVIQILKRRLLV